MSPEAESRKVAVEEIRFSVPTYALEVPGFGRISLEAHPYEGKRGALATLTVRTTKGAATLRHFARPHIHFNGDLVDYFPSLDCAFGNESNPFFALVGLLDVVFVQVDAKVVSQYRLDREEDDDWGFFRSTLIPRERGFVLAYEAQVVSFNFDGAVLWNLPLCLN